MRDPFAASLAPEDWYPHFEELHHRAIAETPDFDWLWLKEHRRELYDSIKVKERELDALGPAPLSRSSPS